MTVIPIDESKKEEKIFWLSQEHIHDDQSQNAKDILQSWGSGSKASGQPEPNLATLTMTSLCSVM